MRKANLTTAGIVVLITMLLASCSKSMRPAEIRFEGYKIQSNGDAYAYFDIGNPNQFPIVCELEVQPSDPRSGSRDYVIPGHGSSLSAGLYVSNTNALSCKITVFRTVPVQHLTLPLQ